MYTYLPEPNKTTYYIEYIIAVYQFTSQYHKAWKLCQLDGEFDGIRMSNSPPRKGCQMDAVDCLRMCNDLQRWEDS